MQTHQPLCHSHDFWGCICLYVELCMIYIYNSYLQYIYIYIYIYVELYVYINIYIEYLINYNQLYINHIHFISIVEHFPLLLQVFVSAALDCPTGSIQVNLP